MGNEQNLEKFIYVKAGLIHVIIRWKPYATKCNTK